MSLVDKTKLIQQFVGAKVDGVYGTETADKLIRKLGLAQPAVKPVVSSLVQGTGTKIKRIFIHCTATREGQNISTETIRGWHQKQGWVDIGYHFVIHLDGTIERGRPESIVGAHVGGHNTGSIGVVYVGGLDANGKAKDTRTPAQLASMAQLVKALVAAYPGSDVLGHRDASPDKNGDGKITSNEWVKECPCFDVRPWWKDAQNT